jgi:6-phosphogluconolactonase (cycloisomerase 2 family)
MAYVGTFSSPLRDTLPTQVDLPPGNGRGIHHFTVDRTTGALTPAGVTEMGTSPGCLAINAAGTRLYSSNETDRAGDDKQGTVSAFGINRPDGRLELLNTVRSGGAGPTYISVHPGGRHLLVANYHGGSVAVLPIADDGRLAEASDVKADAGTVGPARAPHAPPGSFAFSGHDHTHAHMIQADPSGRFVIHTDLGLDRIDVWKFDAQRGVLTPNDPPSVALPPGDGPRHFSFHPNGRWFYSIQEEGSTLVLFDYDGASGRLAARQTISSLPPGFAGSNFCSEVLVSADGRFVYAGNRLHDSIGIFAIGQGRHADLRRRRVDTRELPPELRRRSDGQLPLLLQPACRQRHRVPRRSRDGRARLHRAVRAGRQSVARGVSGLEVAALKGRAKTES